MQTVAIAGVGLIGGSFAMALRRAGFSGRILGISSAGTIRKAVELGVIDEGLPLAEAVSQAELVYLAQPIRAIIDCLPQVEAAARPGTLVTDAGSTKRAIVEAARGALRKAQFLGGHPMAGKESKGVESAEAGLFDERPYVLTPGSAEELETPAARSFLGMLERMRARVVVVSADEHDRMVAYTSHLPQMTSTAIASLLATCDLSNDSLFRVSGPGLRDQTRLAMSSYGVWRDILETNKDRVSEALTAYIEHLLAVREMIGSEAMAGVFRDAEKFARELRESRD